MISKTMLAAALAASMGLVACGGSGKDTAAAEPTATATTPPATTTSAASAAPATSGHKLAVIATEYAFAPANVSVKPGKLAVTLENKGKIPHELILLKTREAATALKIDKASSRVSETTSVGEISELDGGKSAAKTFDLKPGKYVLVCNIPAHYKLGMYGVLTVR